MKDQPPNQPEPVWCVIANIKWDVETGRQLRAFTAHQGIVEDVDFSPDGSVLASISRDLTVKLWNVETGEGLRSLTGHTEWGQSVAFSPDGCILASGANEQIVRLWGIPE